MNHAISTFTQNEGVRSTASSICNGLDLAEAKLLDQLKMVEGLPGTEKALRDELSRLAQLRESVKLAI